MTKRLFIGGLSWDTNEDGLRSAFEQFGEISDLQIISDRDTGRSRGFGFITFEDPGHGEQAINQMDGTMLDGRTIKVNEARERQARGGGGGGFGGGGGGGRGRW